MQSFRRRFIYSVLSSLAVISLSGTLHAQTFQTVPQLYFTKPFGLGVASLGSNPLPQVLTIASAPGTASFSFGIGAPTTSSGGNWLTVSSPAAGCCYSTPQAVTITVNPSAALAANTYSGQIVFTSYGGATSMTVLVTLNVESSTSAFFDDVPGAMSFSLKTGGSAPPAQPLQIRNAGAGTLNWTLTGTTATSANWLVPSVTSGAAPSQVNVGISVQNLPGGGDYGGDLHRIVAFSKC